MVTNPERIHWPSKIFRVYNLEVFIIQAHTSHFTQLFDVIIASPMKSCFSDIF